MLRSSSVDMFKEIWFGQLGPVGQSTYPALPHGMISINDLTMHAPEKLHWARENR